MSNDKAQNSMVRLMLTIDPERSRMGQNKSKCQIPNYKTFVLVFVIVILNLFCAFPAIELILGGIPFLRENFVICNFSFAQGEFKYDAKGKRDPFNPLVTPDGRLLKLDKEEGQAELLLEGIIYDKHALSYAVVNGEVVKIGDKIGDYQVLKIEENKVIFLKEGQPTEVELKKGDE